MFIGFKRLLAAFVLIPGSAFGACVQSDIAGTWRFHFNQGEMTANNRLFHTSCLIVIRSNGVMEPKPCQTLDATMDSSVVTITPPQIPLVVRPNCEVTWARSGAELHVSLGSVGQFADKLQLTLSSDKGTLLGYGLTASGLGILSIHAIKRAQ
jgi:hypothetical protein